MEVLSLVRYACQLARWHYLLVNIDMPWLSISFDFLLNSLYAILEVVISSPWP